MKSKYEIRYLPKFKQDLKKILRYITYELKNENAALRLAEKISEAIIKRSFNPDSFEEYHGIRNRKDKWYRIYVKNYVIFYVVIDNIMEVRRILSKRRNIKNIL